MVELICGRLSRGYERRGRIVGGERSLSRKQWPWLAALLQADGLELKHKCGATLIDESWLVTAAHCLIKTDVTKIRVKLGTDAIDSEDRLTSIRNVSLLLIHNDFNPVTFLNDIALIKLSEPVTFASNVLPACLPRSSQRNETFTGQNGTLIGWGRVAEEGHMPKTLRYVNMTVISNEKCSQEYGQVGYTESMPSQFLCTYDSEGIRKDACEGDSGGPFVIRIENQFTLIGAVSWGIGSSCARLHQPTVYTRITSFVDWIHHVIYD